MDRRRWDRLTEEGEQQHVKLQEVLQGPPHHERPSIHRAGEGCRADPAAA